MITAESLALWVSKLVQIPSVTPVQAGPRSGAPGEEQIAAQISDWFTALGGQVYSEEVEAGRPSIYGIWRGASDRWIGVDVHTDTVGVEQMVGDPFDGRIADGRVFGRGAVDTKATLGVILALLEAIHQAGVTLETNLLIAATADEENGAQSAPIFARWIESQQIPLDQLLVAEPTMCQPVYGHKGSVRFDLTVSGVSSHSAKPHLGKNAIAAAAHLVVALEAEHNRLQSLPPATDLGPATMTVSIIQGGTGRNVVPDLCKVSVGWRSVPGMSVQEILDHVEVLARRSCPLPVEMEFLGSIDPFLQAPDTAWVRQLGEWSNQPPMTVPYGTNAWAHSGRPYDCVVLGPGSIDQAHGDVEWVDISELEKLARIYSRWWQIPQ